MDHHDVDPDWLVNKLPVELKLEIKNFTCLIQMQEAYGTDDLETIASRVGALPTMHTNSFEWEMKALWLNTLLDLGARIPDLPTRTHEDGYGSTPFHCAAAAQDNNLIRRLVRFAYDINAVDSEGDTAIYQVAKWIGGRLRPHLDCLSIRRTLCKEGADVNRLTRQSHWIPYILHRLIHHEGNYDDCLAAFKLLVKYGASTSGALHVLGIDVGDRSYLPYIPVLLDAGADIEELCDNMTPLTAAARQKNPDVVQALIDAGADVNGGGSRILPLFAAIEPVRDHHVYAPTTAATLKVLCDAGADVNRVLNGYDILSFAMIRF